MYGLKMSIAVQSIVRNAIGLWPSGVPRVSRSRGKVNLGAPTQPVRGNSELGVIGDEN